MSVPSALTGLEGKRLVIIGAGSHTGRQLAEVTSAAGAESILAGPDPQKVERTAECLAGTPEVVPLDITDEDPIAGLSQRAGAFDHLVSTASIPTTGPLAELELEAVQRAFAAR
ncbi:SDR family NAD(P)-dependent oxidoreductase [Streptomyces sp. NPDC005813]|uniref:SDR family NAD(P)-dependent oxidoreductase n=1 Tax=Streptomyces sp. NPDC005813 TaxID=3155592 RepID=UPI0033E04648